MINITFRNNTMIRTVQLEKSKNLLIMIRIVAILNRILIILVIKSLLKKLMVCLDNFSALFTVPWVEQGRKSLL
jgi:hypothetical protein